MNRAMAICGISLLSLAAGIGGANAKTLVYCSEASPETFNPMLASADSTMDAAAKTIFNRLVEFKAGTTEVEPALAESWDVSPDGKTYTFHLRQGVKFQSNPQFTPSRDFNADDVLYTFKRQMDATNPYHSLSGASYEYFNALGMGAMIESIDKTDDFTVTFKLKAADVTFLSGLALDYLSILSLEQTEKMVADGHPEIIDSMPVGTGPFTLVDYQTDAAIRFNANADYWKGAPKFDNLIFAITPDPTIRVQKLEAGECKVATQPPPASVESIKKNADIVVLEQEGQNIGFLGFNVQKPPLDNKKVRMALALAIDRTAIVEAVYQGAGTLAGSVLPPTQLGADHDLGISHDPQAAKTLLKEAGFENGFPIALWAMPVSRPYMPNARRAAELIQADWAAIGVQAEIVTFEWADYLQRTAAGEQQAFILGGSSDNGDPDNLLSYFFGCPGGDVSANRSRWCDPAFQKTLEQARIAPDRNERAGLYRAAQAILKAELPAFPIAHSRNAMLLRKNVLNYQLDVFGRQNFSAVDMAE